MGRRGGGSSGGVSCGAVSAQVAFAQVAHGLLAGPAVEAVDEQPAVQVVDLVLEAAREQALPLDHHGLPGPVDPADPGVPGAAERIPEPGDGQASLLVFLLAL